MSTVTNHTTPHGHTMPEAQSGAPVGGRAQCARSMGSGRGRAGSVWARAGKRAGRRAGWREGGKCGRAVWAGQEARTPRRRRRRSRRDHLWEKCENPHSKGGRGRASRGLSGHPS